MLERIPHVEAYRQLDEGSQRQLRVQFLSWFFFLSPLLVLFGIPTIWYGLLMLVMGLIVMQMLPELPDTVTTDPDVDAETKRRD